MAKSEARKKRLKLLRQHGKDVAEIRGATDFSTHVRMTKSKKETLDKEYRKHKKHYEDD
ncbi:hypothetical protein [Lysinibacillus sp. 3P01SB]|uniref:hypothetical protein n=1 Tax=Lysinibacillus sp. 3P01SB TaxID=3132284 RepID=UPI0039A45BC5